MKLEPLIGWEVIQSKVALVRWEMSHGITHHSRITKFPCLVQERLASDECSETYAESLTDVAVMLRHLMRAKKAMEEEKG